MSGLNLIYPPTNVYRNDGAGTTVDTTGSHVIGRLDSKYRLERYKFEVTEPIVKIDFNFTARKNTGGALLNFTHYQGTDFRSSGIYVFISEEENMSDWGDFPQTKSMPVNRVFNLKFQKSYTELVGTIDLSSKPLEQGKTYYLFFYTGNRASSWGGMYWNNSSSIGDSWPDDVSTYISYTAPGKPTSFGFKGNILSKEFTIKWDSAIGGTNNQVVGYQIKLNQGREILVGNVNEYTFDNKDGSLYKEGSAITVQIRTKGEKTNAQYSNWVTITGKANCRPKKPVVSFKQNSGVFRSGTSTLTVNYDEKDADGDTVTCCYKTLVPEQNQTKPIEISEPGDVSITVETSNLTVGFYCSDGKEDSDFVIFTIKRYDLNIEMTSQQSCVRDDITSNTKYQLSFSTSETNYTLAPKAKISLTFIGGDKTETVEEIISTTSNYILDILNKKFDIELKNATSYKVAVFPLTEEGDNFYTNNGKEAVEVVPQPDDSWWGQIFLPPTANEIGVFDNIIFDNEEVTEEVVDEGKFFKDVYFKIPAFDPEIFNYDAFVEFNGARYILIKKTKKVEAQTTSNWYFQATIPITKNLVDSEFTLIFSRSQSQSYSLISNKYIQIPEFSFANLEIANWSEIDPVYGQSSFSFKFFFSEEVQDTYAISDLTWDNLRVCFIYGSNTCDFLGWSEIQTSESLKTTTITYPLAPLVDELFNPIDYYGKKDILCLIEIKNKYGHSSSSEIFLKANFDKDPILKFEEFTLTIDSTNTPITDDFCFLQGMPLKFNCSITAYSKNNIEYLELIDCTTTSLDVLHRWSIEDIKNIEGIEDIENSFEGTEYTFELPFFVPQIKEKKSIIPALRFGQVISKLEGEKSYVAFPVIEPRHINLKKINYDGEKTYTLSYDFETSYQEDEKVVYSCSQFLFSSSGQQIPFQSNEIEIEWPDDSNPLKNEESTVMYVHIQETFTNSGYTLTKFYNSNTVPVYNLLPTVAYRKNRLIINSKEGQNDSVLYISRASDAHMIRLKIQDQTGKSRGDVTIDLYSGAINNALINGGSWDSGSDGLIPDENLPSGLAAIAYSGDISDLKQTKDITIVFDGGDAEKI